MKYINPVFFIVSSLIANDLIVDHMSRESYQEDNFVQFDPFLSDGYSFCGNIRPPHGSPAGCDKVEFDEDFPVLGTNFTIELWIYSDSSSVLHREIIGVGGDPSGNFNQRPPTITYNYRKQIRYGFGIQHPNYDSRRFIVDNVRTENSWNHIAFTYDGSKTRLFVNGERVHVSSNISGEIPVQIPISNLGDGFYGKIDEVRIWEYARLREDILETMNTELTGDETGLLAYYPMEINRSLGNAEMHNNWELVDVSGNNHNAQTSGITIGNRYYSDNCQFVDGSFECPYPTINSALDVVRGGDRIFIREGRYTEQISRWHLNHSYETLSNKIVIEGFDNENVVIDGTISIHNTWEQVNLNGYSVYKTIVNLDSISHVVQTPVNSIFGLFIDDRYMIPSMEVNFKNPTDKTTGNPLNPEPGTVWSLGLTYADASNSGTLAVLDTLEEWAFDPAENALYVIPSNGYIPNSSNVRVRIRDKIFTLMHSDNFEIKNIKFNAGSVSFYNCSYLTIEDSKFSYNSDFGLAGNTVVYGTNTAVRNCVFEYNNAASAWHQQRTMYPIMENVLFRYNDWFAESANYPVTDRNYRGSSGSGNLIHGGSVWRYITVENCFTAGIFPGYRSLVEYARLENLYDGCDCSGVQRNGHNTVGSTTRYSWKLNGARNGIRFNSSCGGNNADIHHVVSLGGKRGFRMKGDYHEAYHLLAYDNRRQDISLPSYKYCGLDMNGDPEIGNLNSNLKNSIAESSLECNSPDCGDSLNSSLLFQLNNSGIWYGRMLSNDYPPSAYPQLELQLPWVVNRELSNEDLVSTYGENPFQNSMQNYDFRPKKGSILIDGGKLVPGINDGQNIEMNHASHYSGQNRSYIGNAPDIGAYEYGDSVYWIPGYRYDSPSSPVPSNESIEIPIEYGLAFNYPWKTDYSSTSALVSINGYGIDRMETLQYPNNVVFETFHPGKTYTWSVTVDGVSGGVWSFTVSNKEYPINDRSVDTSVGDSLLYPYQLSNLKVNNYNLSFLKFDVPSSVNNQTYFIKLNLVAESVDSLSGGVILYQYNNIQWGEKLDENNIGIVDHSDLTSIDTIYSIEEESQLQIDISNIIDHAGVYSFALGVVDSADDVTFYSKEKLVTDGNYPNEYGGYAPLKRVWPNLSFQLQNDLSISKDLLPDKYNLNQNYPNPFNSTTKIEYELPQTSNVQLKIYDILGREIVTLVNEMQEPGYKSVNWHGRDQLGSKVSAGMYFYLINAGNFTKIKKMILLK